MKLLWILSKLRVIINQNQSNINLIFPILNIIMFRSFRTLPIRNLLYASRRTFFNQQKFDSSKDYYKILGVDKKASDSDIKKAYYMLAKQYHPDLNKGNQARFKEISEAYEVLSSQTEKKNYDTARTFGGFAGNFRSKAQSGSYRYSEYQNMYQNMKPQEQQQIRKKVQDYSVKIGVGLVSFIIFWSLFGRTPSMAYQEINGQLIPVDLHMHGALGGRGQQGFQNRMAYQQGGFNPQQGYSSPYNYNPSPNNFSGGYGGNSYSSNGYANPGYGSSGYGSTGYGSSGYSNPGSSSYGNSYSNPGSGGYSNAAYGGSSSGYSNYSSPQ